MSDSHFLRPVARWLCVLMLAGILCPRMPAWAADAPASETALVRMGAAVVDLANNKVVLSAGERDRGWNIFRIMRHGEEIAQVKCLRPPRHFQRARVRGGAQAQLRLNDRAGFWNTGATKAFRVPIPLGLVGRASWHWWSWAPFVTRAMAHRVVPLAVWRISI